MSVGQSATWKILQGHSLEVLRRLESESVQTCITSPPYFGLRDYGMTEQIGLEETPELYITRLVEIFREVKRVLRKDGTLWVNIGDSYFGSLKGSGGTGHLSTKQNSNKGANYAVSGPCVTWQTRDDLKSKDLIGIPWALAFALRTDGWYLRSEIIWHKPNPMPESVTDRPTKSHEQIFLLSKSPNYFYDAEAISEPIKTESFERASRGVSENHKNLHIPGQTQHTMHKARANGEGYQLPERRNKRSVWSVNVGGYSDAHFATFPEELITPCVLAGSKEGDTVLDPFSGSGTTGLVSVKYGRNYVGVELNPSYVALSEMRISREAPSLFSIRCLPSTLPANGTNDTELQGSLFHGCGNSDRE